jgi:hypothetical protein
METTHHDFCKYEREEFLRRDLERHSRLDSARQIFGFAHTLSRKPAAARRAHGGENGWVLPVGQISRGVIRTGLRRRLVVATKRLNTSSWALQVRQNRSP